MFQDGVVDQTTPPSSGHFSTRIHNKMAVESTMTSKNKMAAACLKETDPRKRTRTWPAWAFPRVDNTWLYVGRTRGLSSTTTRGKVSGYGSQMFIFYIYVYIKIFFWDKNDNIGSFNFASFDYLGI